MSGEPERVLFHVQHLLGVGHIHRARLLIGGFRKAGLAVDVVHGGIPVDGFDYEAESVTFLPALRARDASFADILDETGQPVSEAYRTRRAKLLVETFDSLQPDAIVIEAWPFGRRVLRKEMAALMKAAAYRRIKPLVITSVRDILQEGRKPGRSEEAVDNVRAHIDHVLVHTDPALVPLDATFPLTDRIADCIAYTGYVVPESAVVNAQPFDVIVTAGGGAFGADLLATAAEAAQHFPEERWCMATGPNGAALPVPDTVTLVDRIDGLAAHMAKAGLSISQCGYNTAMDVLSSGVKAVFVPHDTTGQTEQKRRAELLGDKGYAICVPQSDLTVDGLVDAIAKARALRSPVHRPDLSGVQTSAALLAGWLAERGA